MFHDGDLQSGIGKALQESKLVACFVTDDREESDAWENEFLKEPELKLQLSSQTVLLRLKAGSQEAGYLAALFPLPKTPTVVIIKNGELREYLAAGITKDEFLRRMRLALESPVSETSPTSAAPLVSSVQSEAAMPLSTTPTNDQQRDATPSRENAQSPADLLAERKARLEKQEGEQHKDKDPKGKGKALSESKPQKEVSGNVASTSSDQNYALMQKKRQQEAREERARILKLVENDKAQRRQHAAKQRNRGKADVNAEIQGPSLVSSSTPRNGPSAESPECAVQVRLFDGSTIRSRFPSHGNLRTNVRPWVHEKQGGDFPYTFKQVLTPLPNKNISISEEEESLRTLGLTPSATLILVPVDGYTSAYEGSSSGGLIYRGAATGYNFISSGVGLVTGVLGNFLGGGGTATAREVQENTPATPAPSSSINVRTLRDQQRPDDQQFYNGNALNFEPRKDETNNKED